MDKAIQDVTLGTVGWFAFAGATVGITKGQTLRLSVVNLGPFSTIVFCGLWSNPRPISLTQDSYTIGPGEAGNCDLNDSDIPREIFDKTGRAQIRAFVRCNSRTICSNIEVFDNETGRTSIILALQEMVHRD